MAPETTPTALPTLPSLPALAGTAPSAALDSAHVGDIHGAMGTITMNGQSSGRWGRRLRTLAAIVGPGLIVMVGDNDAGAFGTYTQAGQNYGTTLLWTLLLLIPVIYVNQEMVLRLGAVTGVGHARLIAERFGRFWGAFSVIDLFILNALTIVTEFIGISLGLSYLGLPKIPGVLLAAVIIVAAASTGSFARFERVCLALVAGSLVLIPILVMVHPPVGAIAHDFLIPALPGAENDLSTVMLLIIAIVGTTVAPWQLFFQQSYIIDKRITPRFLAYERVDLVLGIIIVVLGAVAMMSFSAAAFAGTDQVGQFSDAAGIAAGLEAAGGKAAGVLFAMGLIDASIIGAAAVGLSTSYAVGDLVGVRHSLHRRPHEAKAFYAVFGGLLLGSAVIVLIPGSPLGLITEGVQTLAGVLLPSATMFLLLLCNDRAVLGPWVNSWRVNTFTTAVIAVLIMLSAILTASVLFPDLSAQAMIAILATGSTLTLAAGAAFAVHAGRARIHQPGAPTRSVGTEPADKTTWRMPPLALLDPPVISAARRGALALMWVYLIVSSALVIVRIIQLALGH